MPRIVHSPSFPSIEYLLYRSSHRIVRVRVTLLTRLATPPATPTPNPPPATPPSHTFLWTYKERTSQLAQRRVSSPSPSPPPPPYAIVWFAASSITREDLLFRYRSLYWFAA